MKTILVFRIGYLNLSQLKHFLLHLCSQLKRKGGLGLTRRIGNNLNIVLQEHQKTNKNILYFFKFIRTTFYSIYCLSFFNPNRLLEVKHILFYYRADYLALYWIIFDSLISKLTIERIADELFDTMNKVCRTKQFIQNIFSCH